MSTDLAYLQFTLSNNISNIMVLDVNVLGPLREYLIFSKVYSTLTVTEQGNENSKGDTRFNVKNPLQHREGKNHGRQPANSSLFFGVFINAMGI